LNWESFLASLSDWFRTRDLLAPGNVLVVGASGGPDSTLLTHALKELSDRQNLAWKLHVAHFNHGLRGAEADADERFVAELAESLGLPFHAERANIRARSQQEKGSTEEIARRQRYEMLERVALASGSDLVAVAHHADDNAETILHRICRGTGLRGLAGIADDRPARLGSRVRVIRPLLALHRSAIEKLCGERGLQCRVDSSNISAEFTRNRIRNTVLPLLRAELNPNITDALLRLAEQARWVGDYLDEAGARSLEALQLAETPHHIVLDAPALLGKHKAIQAEVVRRAITLSAGGEQELGFAHVEAVLRLAADPASGKELHLPGRVVARKQYDRLEFLPLAPEEPTPELPTVLVNCPGHTQLPALGSELLIEIVEVEGATFPGLVRDLPVGQVWMDLQHLRPPLVVRGRRDGDRFHPLGAPGAKSISDFLIDEKVEPALRGRTGLLCDQDGPVWVMPLRIDERVKLTAATQRAVRITLRAAKVRQMA
jgi:tRNA(Ile)-lysidine synthase